MSVIIVKTKFADDLACFEVDEGADDESDEEFGADIRVITKQWNHSTRAANRAYANQLNPNFGERVGWPHHHDTIQSQFLECFLSPLSILSARDLVA